MQKRNYPNPVTLKHVQLFDIWNPSFSVCVYGHVQAHDAYMVLFLFFFQLLLGYSILFHLMNELKFN